VVVPDQVLVVSIAVVIFRQLFQMYSTTFLETFVEGKTTDNVRQEGQTLDIISM
jgi:hypothetical protein